MCAPPGQSEPMWHNDSHHRPASYTRQTSCLPALLAFCVEGSVHSRVARTHRQRTGGHPLRPGHDHPPPLTNANRGNVMSSKTRTRKTRTTTTSTTGSARPLRSVPDQPSAMKVRTETEDKLWAALHAHPNSTAADLSAAAKIGKSTAQKILARWAGDGSVTRTPGIADGGRRAADLWAITGVDDIGDHGDDAP